ncbi:hypothetical protein Agabi119p4_1232 [Agaricus bisporus var. burnettii]|uniref:Ribosomal protein S16 n=1 Tax=Agaricus bisporus var. burnettii TaxID=192524 RepID=A0A8H7KLZ7_AGABI|nr:hypothetical protein Agabi119p4_1232 [Agaricus bisporus var. burnettii]
MAIRLRFAVHGLRNNRVLHLVAVDHRKARDARPAELLGVYRHRVEETGGKKSLEWSVDRIRYWLKNGAMPSPPVVRLLEMGGILAPGSPYHPSVVPTTASANKTSAKSTKPTTTRNPKAAAKSS